MASWLWNQKSSPDRFERIGIALFVLGHAVATWFSFGYNHPDEHFQILEFAAYFTGINQDPAILPWEYAARIRPWFQPMIHALPMKVLSLLGCYQAFNLATVFRALYSLANLWALWSLWNEFKSRFKIDTRWFLLIGTLWFFPYIHVRNSSENLSGIFLTFAFSAWMAGRGMFQCGLWFGFAFLARYQVALGVAGLGVCLLWQDRKITRSHLTLLAGFLSVVALGALVDRVGYGEWVFAPYRYFKVNLIDGVAATFNPYPWYQYFIWILELNPVVSLPLFFGVIFYAKKEKLDPLSSFVLAFFFIHLFITNKEYRFLFPLMNLVALMTIRAFHESPRRWLKAPFLSAYGISSGLGFFISSFHGASAGSLWCVHAADRLGKPGETWLSNRDFVQEFRINYYRIPHLGLALFSSASDLEQKLSKTPPTHVLLDAKIGDPNTRDMIQVLNQRKCSIEMSDFPVSLLDWQDRFPTLKKIAYRAVYWCEIGGSANSNP